MTLPLIPLSYIFCHLILIVSILNFWIFSFGSGVGRSPMSFYIFIDSSNLSSVGTIPDIANTDMYENVR